MNYLSATLINKMLCRLIPGLEIIYDHAYAVAAFKNPVKEHQGGIPSENIPEGICVFRLV